MQPLKTENPDFKIAITSFSIFSGLIGIIFTFSFFEEILLY